MNEKQSCCWNLCHFHQSISVKNLLLMPLLSRAGYFFAILFHYERSVWLRVVKNLWQQCSRKGRKASSEQHLYRLLFQRLHTDVLTAPVSPFSLAAHFL